MRPIGDYIAHINFLTKYYWDEESLTLGTLDTVAEKNVNELGSPCSEIIGMRRASHWGH